MRIADVAPKPPLRLPRGMYYGWIIVAVSFMGNWITAPLNPVVFSIFIVPIRHDLGVGLSTLAWCITVPMVSAGISAPILGALARGTQLVKLENLDAVVKNKEALHRGHDLAVVQALH